MASLETSTRFQWADIGFDQAQPLFTKKACPMAFAHGNSVYLVAANRLVEYNTVTEAWSVPAWSHFPGVLPKVMCQAENDVWLLGGTGIGYRGPDYRPLKMWRLDLSEEVIEAVEDGGTRPPARLASTLNYLPAAQELILYGGHRFMAKGTRHCIPQAMTEPRPQSELYAFNRENRSWRKVAPTGQRPLDRYVTATSTNNDDTIFVYGGAKKQRYLIDFFLLKWSAGGVLTWSSPQLTGFLPVRVRRSSISIVGNRMFVFNGASPIFKKGTTSVADLEEDTWYRIKNVTDPIEGAYPLVGEDFAYIPGSCVALNNKIYVFSANLLFGRALVPVPNED